MYITNILSLLQTANPSFEILAFRHAISTPLTILLASFEELESTTSKNKQLLQKYKQAVVTLQQLTQTFAAIETQSDTCNISQMLHEISQLLVVESTKIKCVVTGGRYVLLKSVNAARVKEALVCLVKNAVEASDGSGSDVVITCGKKKNYIWVAIKDYGQGLPWWKQQIISLPLISFKQQGSGVGLPFARRVIEKELGGQLTITSKSGFGTTVECLIPCVR